MARSSIREKRKERPEEEHELTAAEAEALIRRERGSWFWIGSRVELPIAGDPGRCFPGYTVTRISMREAITIAHRLLEGFEARGARLRIKIRGANVYIGG